MTVSTEVNEISGEESKGFFSTIKSKITNTLDDIKEIAPDTDQVKSGVSSQTAKVTRAYGQVKSTVTRDTSPELAPLLREWAPALKGRSKDSQATVDWLLGLPTDELKNFTRKLQSFLSSLNLNLAWLVNPTTAQALDDNLKQAMTEIVQHYSLAVWKAGQIQNEVDSFNTLTAWLDDPTAKKYADFNQQMFAKLVEAKLVPAPPMDLFLAPEAKRQAYFAQAIREVMEKDRKAFNSLLKENLDSSALEETASETPSAETAADPPEETAGSPAETAGS